MRRVDPTAGAEARPDATAPAGTTVVRAGGAGGLDRALELAVGPAVAELSATWSFVRWVDARGPQLRIDVRDADVDAFRRAVLRRLPEVLDAPAREPVLPLPASQRVATGWSVEPLDDEAELPRGPGHHAACTAVVQALGALGDGRDRLAFALAAVRALPGTGGLDWHAVALDLAGGGDRAERALERLRPTATDLAPDLDRRAAGLEGAAVEARDRIAGAVGVADRPAEGAHLLCNRLGVSPLEELVLALVLDGATEAAAPGPGAEPPVGEDAGDDPPRRRKAAVRLRDVSLAGETGPLLSDVSLTVRRGEVFGVLGDDPDARSAVLSVALGRRHPTEGRVRLFGTDPREADATPDGEVGVPEVDDALSPGLTVRENVAALTSAAPEAVEDALRRTGLLDDAGRRVSEVPAGHRRRTAVACALVRPVDLLGLDDPAGDLDAVGREGVWTVVDGRREDDGTTLLVTGSIQEAVELCDRVALLRDGRVVDVGRPARIADEHYPLVELHLRVEASPDAALLRDLPEVDGLEIDERPGHWVVRLDTRQPDVLLRLLDADPAFPAVATAETFPTQHPETPETTTG